MNALTKAFVVVVTVLAVILVALVVPFAARVPDYAQQYSDLKLELEAQAQRASLAATSARDEMAAKGEQLATAQQQIAALSSELAMRGADVTALQAQLVQKDTATSRAIAAQEVAVKTNENQRAQLAEQSEVIRKNIGDLGELQGQIADLTQRIITVNSENRRLSDNYLRIQEENKALVTQLNEAVAKYDTLLKNAIALGYDPKGGVATPVPGPGTQIKGSVVKIDQVSDDLTFVQLNVGSRDQVKQGMEFTVFRGDKFVGKIKVATVDAAECVGRVTLGGGVQEGDAVRAGGR